MEQQQKSHKTQSNCIEFHFLLINLILVMFYSQRVVTSPQPIESDAVPELQFFCSKNVETFLHLKCKYAVCSSSKKEYVQRLL